MIGDDGKMETRAERLAWIHVNAKELVGIILCCDC